METQDPRTAAAYVRVSTEEQTEQSPESQLVEIRKYAASHHLILPDDLVFMDEGISGRKSENRPAFQRMIGAAKEKPPPFDVILIWKFSRFARNQEESIVYKTLLRKQCGVDVVSISEPLPGGQFSTLIERIIEWFDEFYSIRLGQEVKRSMTVKAAKGEFQSRPPYGYRIRKDAEKKGVLEVVPEEAQVVRDIFSRYSTGEGCFAISQALNAQGLRTRKGVTFSNKAVEYILRNPIYAGKVRWNPKHRVHDGRPDPDTIVADGGHEPIVSLELYEATQERLETVRAAYGYKARPACELKDWLSGLVRCAECGATLIFYRNRYFKCNNYAHGKCSYTQIVAADVLHDAVTSQLKADLAGQKGIAYTVTQKSQTQDDVVSCLRSKIKDLQRRDGRLLDAYLGGAVSLEQFKAAKDSLTASIEEAEKRITEIEAAQREAGREASMRERIREALEELILPDASLEEKNNALRQIAERIVFSKDRNTLDITYRLIF